MIPQQNQNMPYMMGQMGMGVGPGQNVRYPGHMGPGNRMGVRPPQGFQQIPPSGPMMRQQVGPMGGPPPDLQQQQRMRFPSGGMGNMMGVPPKQVSMSHTSPQPQGGGSGPPMWNPGPGGHPMHGNVPMGSGSPHPHSPMQPTAIGSPRPQGDPNHGSPMMPQSIRSQTPGGGGMPNQIPLPNNPAAMSQMRMPGSQVQMGSVNPRMPMLPQQQQQSQQPQLQQSSPQHQHQNHQPSPMSHPHHSPMNVNHHSPMNPQMMGGPNSFVPSPMNPSSGVPQQRSGTPASAGGPKRTSTPSDEFNLDFLDNISPSSGNGSANGPSQGNPGQKRGQLSRSNDELLNLFN